MRRSGRGDHLRLRHQVQDVVAALHRPLDRGRRGDFGPIQGSGDQEVGETVTATLRGDELYSRSLTLPLVLLGLGLPLLFFPIMWIKRLLAGRESRACRNLRRSPGDRRTRANMNESMCPNSGPTLSAPPEPSPFSSPLPPLPPSPSHLPPPTPPPPPPPPLLPLSPPLLLGETAAAR